MATIARNGIRLAYDDRGAGEPAFVFVHGWTCDRSFFAPQAEHFARRHRVVSVDLRGHGESDKPEGPYPIARLCGRHRVSHRPAWPRKVVAVGHSIGRSTPCYSWPHPIPTVWPPSSWSTPLRSSFRLSVARLEAMAAAIEAGNQEPRREFIMNICSCRRPIRN